MKLTGVPVGYTRLTKSQLTPEELTELEAVDRLATRLHAYLEASAEAIDLVHIHGARSGAVQDITSRLLREELGFDEEKRLAAQAGLTTMARPDFIFRLSPGRGILAEVERGGTTTNNHDLKDFWKAHIAPDAHHLFLIVPHSNWNEAGAGREKPYVAVKRRLGAFFGDARREVDVVSVHLGYGRTSP